MANELKYTNNKKASFSQFARLQLGVHFEGVDIGMYYSVTQAGIDRAWLHDKLENGNIDIQNEIIEQIRQLKGKGYAWDIWYINGEHHKFDIDTENAEDFIPFFEKYDREGMYSDVLKRFYRNDPRISKDNLVDTCIEVFKDLYPLYMAMVWKVK